MAETIVSLKQQTTRLKNQVAKLKEKAKEGKEMTESMPRALELLDNLCIAAEGDGTNIAGAASAAREFLDTLPANLQTSFRDWHPTRGGSI